MAATGTTLSRIFCAQKKLEIISYVIKFAFFFFFSMNLHTNPAAQARFNFNAALIEKLWTK